MVYNFCTLFDSNYFSRGLVLYHSLKNTGINFHIYIFAFDDNVYNKLKSINLKNATIITLNEFETPELLIKKKERTRAEYCWTCTPSTIYYCIDNYNLDNCTYIDADMFFYNTPEIIFNEIGSYSVAITDHNYYNKYNQSKTSGQYCVQFVYFKNDSNGISALNWWKESCINWCFSRLEDGKFGDQKYLDSFQVLFDNVLVITNKGAGVAPWNANRFNLMKNKNNELIVHDIYTSYTYQLIFFHFHSLSYKVEADKIKVNPSKFNIPSNYIKLIYSPYILRLFSFENDQEKMINEKNILFNEYSWIFIKYLDLRLLLKKMHMFRFLYSRIYKSTK